MAQERYLSRRSARLDSPALERLDLHRVAPGLLGWVLEIAWVPVSLLGLLFTSSRVLSAPPDLTPFLVGVPPSLCVLANLTFLAHTALESGTARADILYLRNYSKPSFVESEFTREPGFLQLLVKGLLRPPYDLVSIFPPARNVSERQRDARRMRRRGIHHVFMVRTRNDAAWKSAVTQLLATVRLVIVECHVVSGGFAWELEQLPDAVPPGSVILVGEAADRSEAKKIKMRLEQAYGERQQAADLPVIILEPGSQGAADFKASLMDAVKSRSPDWDELAMERAPTIMLEIVLKIATVLLTLGWWTTAIIAAITMVALSLG